MEQAHRKGHSTQALQGQNQERQLLLHGNLYQRAGKTELSERRIPDVYGKLLPIGPSCELGPGPPCLPANLCHEPLHTPAVNLKHDSGKYILRKSHPSPLRFNKIYFVKLKQPYT